MTPSVRRELCSALPGRRSFPAPPWPGCSQSAAARACPADRAGVAPVLGRSGPAPRKRRSRETVSGPAGHVPPREGHGRVQRVWPRGTSGGRQRRPVVCLSSSCRCQSSSVSGDLWQPRRLSPGIGAVSQHNTRPTADPSRSVGGGPQLQRPPPLGRVSPGRWALTVCLLTWPDDSPGLSPLPPRWLW